MTPCARPHGRAEHRPHPEDHRPGGDYHHADLEQATLPPAPPLRPRLRTGQARTCRVEGGCVRSIPGGVEAGPGAPPGDTAPGSYRILLGSCRGRYHTDRQSGAAVCIRLRAHGRGSGERGRRRPGLAVWASACVAWRWRSRRLTRPATASRPHLRWCGPLSRSQPRPAIGQAKRARQLLHTALVVEAGARSTGSAAPTGFVYLHLIAVVVIAGTDATRLAALLIWRWHRGIKARPALHHRSTEP
jgi:hypothetical protein